MQGLQDPVRVHIVDNQTDDGPRLRESYFSGGVRTSLDPIAAEGGEENEGSPDQVSGGEANRRAQERVSAKFKGVRDDTNLKPGFSDKKYIL